MFSTNLVKLFADLNKFYYVFFYKIPKNLILLQSFVIITLLVYYFEFILNLLRIIKSFVQLLIINSPNSLCYIDKYFNYLLLILFLKFFN